VCWRKTGRPRPHRAYILPHVAAQGTLRGLVAGRLARARKRARIVKSAGGLCGRRFLQGPQDCLREDSDPEHANDFRKAQGGGCAGFTVVFLFKVVKWSKSLSLNCKRKWDEL